MRRLVVCFDGTWNKPGQEDDGVPSPTNVCKIYNAILDEETSTVPQIRYYHPGLGATGGLKNWILGGAFGVGISRHICSAYHWLGSTYREGDEIFLYGFSRGAYTVRCIAGLLGYGLPRLEGLASTDAWDRVKRLYKAYRERPKRKRQLAFDWVAKEGLDWELFHLGEETPVRFVGVWDTVGALGIPDDAEILNLFDDKTKWQFRNTKLGSHVATGRHAMAVDEMRADFTVTRWANAATHGDAKELWFPGVHADVGGGYAECGLADGALLWMIEESKAAGLEFVPNVEGKVSPNPLGVMHNSYKGLFAKLRSRPRNLAPMVPDSDCYHESAKLRQQVSPIAYPPYHPTRILEVGESWSGDVYADTRWNATGLYLPAGHSFTFSATGEWQDGNDTCDWKGTEDSTRTRGDAIRRLLSVFGKAEGLLTDNPNADLYATKRVERLPWFVLVGAITNDHGAEDDPDKQDGPVPHQYVDLTVHTTNPLQITNPGYLFCFPNDAWKFYANNRGSIRLTVTRKG